MSSAHFHRLCIPLRRDLDQFKHELHELHRQFETIRNDPHARSNNPDKQFAYKTRLVLWYFEGIPRAKYDLLQRLVSFWNAVPSATAVVVFYEQEMLRTDGDVPPLMKMELDSHQSSVQGMQRMVLGLYTDMEQLMRLNPKWRGAGKCPLFTLQGCLLGSDPNTEKCAAWIEL